jgi:hypothetical protein
VPKLTVTVITRNESANLAPALESVSWAEETLVVDSRSTDDTAEIARRHGARVLVRDWPGYSAQKNFAASEAAHDWILSIDADERVTPELAAEIQHLLSGEPAERGYRIPRVSFYLGRWIRSTDWYPDYQLRLYDRRVSSWAGLVHEGVEVRGPVGRLRADLQHVPYRDMAHHLQTIDRYTTLVRIVGVHDVGTQLADHAGEAPCRGQVDLVPGRQRDRLHVGGQPVAQLAVRVHDDGDAVAARAKPARRQQHLVLAPAPAASGVDLEREHGQPYGLLFRPVSQSFANFRKT